MNLSVIHSSNKKYSIEQHIPKGYLDWCMCYPVYSSQFIFYLHISPCLGQNLHYQLERECDQWSMREWQESGSDHSKEHVVPW